MAIRSRCSNGRYVTQGTINSKYYESKQKKYEGITYTLICEGCNLEPSIDNDHTIAQARCKVIHKTELIWNPKNYVRSCRICHREWESYKSGDYLNHKNVVERLIFMRDHDFEGFVARIQFTDPSARLEEIKLLVL